MMCDNITSETNVQIIFSIEREVYEKIGMMDRMTKCISCQWEMGYSTAPPSQE